MLELTALILTVAFIAVVLTKIARQRRYEAFLIARINYLDTELRRYASAAEENPLEGTVWNCECRR